MLKLSNGSWSDDPRAIKSHAVNFFKWLISSEPQQGAGITPSGVNIANAADMKNLLNYVTMDEVRSIVFGMEHTESGKPLLTLPKLCLSELCRSKTGYTNVLKIEVINATTVLHGPFTSPPHVGCYGSKDAMQYSAARC
ncbi:hypothetical protein V6N13_016772 [Hibiscus sabdariffa]